MNHKLIAYVRVSTDGQLDGFGPAAQQAACERFAELTGHEIVGVETESITGTALDRPGFRRVLDAIDAGEAEGVLVARFDRLARQLTTQEALLALVWGAGGRVFTADTGEVLEDDPDDPMRTAMRQMAGVMAEFDRASTVSRLKRGREAKARAGLYSGGGVPFGFRYDRELERLVEDAEEQATVKALLVSYERNQNYTETAAALNLRGLRPRKGATWSATQVRRVVLKQKETE